MNKVLQTEQMDGCVRFWSDECNQVKTHYLGSPEAHPRRP